MQLPQPCLLLSFCIGFALCAKPTQKALADLNRALVLDPKLADAWANHGHAIGSKGDLRQALADYD